MFYFLFFFSSRRRHTRLQGDWSSDVCSSDLRYGMGISVADIGGRHAIAHGGGISGFLSEVEYYPDDDLVVVVLLNTAGPVAPRDIAKQIVDQVLPKPND